MGKKRTRRYKTDPVVDQFAVANAQSMLLGNLFSMGWRLTLTVLVPLFVGVQLDKRFDSAPSLTLAAFFVAIFGAGVLIAQTYKDMTSQQMREEEKTMKRKARLLKRRKHV